MFHGQLTPGGGFQGGVVLAAGPIAILLAGRYLSMKRVAPKRLAESADAIGAAAYALVGLGGLIFAGVYLKNFLPLGSPGKLLSAGMMPLNSIAVGLEVTGAFLMTWSEFLDQTTFGRRRAAEAVDELPSLRRRRVAVRDRALGRRLESEPGSHRAVA